MLINDVVLWCRDLLVLLQFRIPMRVVPLVPRLNEFFGFDIHGYVNYFSHNCILVHKLSLIGERPSNEMQTVASLLLLI